jgi:hypothetical protein
VCPEPGGSGHTEEPHDHAIVKGGIERGFLRVIGPHQEGGNPVPQVRDFVEVLVRGGVAVQFAQFLGDAAGADAAGGVQGLVSEGGGLERVAGDHRETGQLSRGLSNNGTASGDSGLNSGGLSPLVVRMWVGVGGVGIL